MIALPVYIVPASELHENGGPRLVQGGPAIPILNGLTDAQRIFVQQLVDVALAATSGNLAIWQSGALADAGIPPAEIADGPNIVATEAPAGTFTLELTDTGVGASAVTTYVAELTVDAKGRITDIVAGQLTDNGDGTHSLDDALIIDAVVSSLQGLTVQDLDGNGILFQRVDGGNSYSFKVGGGNSTAQEIEARRLRLIQNSATDLSGTKTTIMDIQTSNNVLWYARHEVNIPAAGIQAFRLIGASGQTANILETLANGGSTIQFAIGPSGQIKTNQSAANTNTPSGATAYQLPIYDETGSLLGYIPVYGSAW